GVDAPATTPDGAVVDPPPPARGFQIISPDITINPGQEITYCYYFKTPNTETLAIKRWSSVMTPGSHHMIMYTTTGENPSHPPGSAPTPDACGAGTGGVSIPVWTYSAQNSVQDLPMPTDDGAGKPVGMEIAAGQNAHFQMHYLNTSDLPIQAHVTLNAEAYDAGVAFTPTAAYVTYNADLNIPPGDSTTAPQSCTVPTTSKFWTMSTHVHHRGTKTEVKDAAAMKFSSTNWEHPGAAAWNPGFNTFASGKLTYTCSYHNELTTNVQDGNSAVDNEMCMAVGYFFPATKPTICYSGVVLPF
ncbi:MAG: hypothetical protein NT062_10240, partial [Proteobacteria bacterium]|nr:hypothetical protein [Pseudomonadota bacterium]